MDKLVTRHFLHITLCCAAFLMGEALFAQHSVARQWNEKLLKAITRDFARPPVQARNLYHVSAAMYEAWAAYEPKAEPFLLGRIRAGYDCHFDGIAIPVDIQAAREEAMSYAAYRLIVHRFQNSPGVFLTMLDVNGLMNDLGYNIANTSENYIQGGAAELGNYIAAQIIAYGMQDGSFEQFNFSNQYYTPVNIPMVVDAPGNPNMTHPDRWQQLTLAVAVDQQGNPVPSTLPFQSPEWGNVNPFALQTSQSSDHVRDGNTYRMYLDPGAPPYLDTTALLGLESFYKWNFCMVPIWQSHLDPDDNVMIDISPASQGGLQTLPQTEQEIRDFYDYFEGGVPSPGHALNPVTGEPYAPQVVKRGDYARILAEFWADGPASETPPGHWFSIMHTVMDHPLFERNWMGMGEVMDELQYDVKAHFALAGALHDAAITAWSIKGWYDYVRPISAVRYMADKGQCSDPLQPNFHPAGLPLIPGYIELVTIGDPLAGTADEHVGKAKLYTWRGHDHISDPETDAAGVGWILAENWFPYQRPTFVTPPFAGYISGHSTYSRTAAEVLTMITGDPYFPGGLSNFLAPQNDFLVFEQGPSEDIYLQWATYRDASDQCSLSRIWGGIHPPIDDIPGRLLGMVIGPQAVEYANSLFQSDRPAVVSVVSSQPVLNIDLIGGQFALDITYDQDMDITVVPTLEMPVDDPLLGPLTDLGGSWLNATTYRHTYALEDMESTLRDIYIRISGAVAQDGLMQDVFLADRPYLIDTERPQVASVAVSTALINDEVAAQGQMEVFITYNEDCDPGSIPEFNWTSPDDLSSTLLFDPLNSVWLAPHLFKAVFQVVDNNEEIALFGLEISNVQDLAGNLHIGHVENELLAIDTREPIALVSSFNNDLFNLTSVGEQALIVEFSFDEEMDTSSSPIIMFLGGDPLGTSLIPDPVNSLWLNGSEYRAVFALLDAGEEFYDLGVSISGATDLAGNGSVAGGASPLFTIDTERPSMLSATPSVTVVSDSDAGAGMFSIAVQFSEPMSPGIYPTITFNSMEDVTTSLIHEPGLDQWIDPLTFVAGYTVADEGREVSAIGINVSGGSDMAGNTQPPALTLDLFDLDTRNPELLILTASTYTVGDQHIGPAGLQFVAIFDEPMHQGTDPLIQFSEDLSGSFLLNDENTTWLSNTAHRTTYDVQSGVVAVSDIGVLLTMATDLAGNAMVTADLPGYLLVNITVGIEEHMSGVFDIFPNPCTPGTPLWLELGSHPKDPFTRIYNAQGKLVFEDRLIATRPGLFMLMTPLLASGSYLISIEDNGLRTHARLVVME